MSKAVLAVVALTAAGLASAQAGDFPYGSRAPYTVYQPLNAFSWAGPYLGGNLGYNWGTVDNNPTKPSGLHATHDLASGQLLQHSDVTIVQVDNLPGVRQNSGDVAGHVVLAVTETDQQGTPLPRGDDLIRIPARHHRDPVRPFDLRQRVDDGFFE